VLQGQEATLLSLPFGYGMNHFPLAPDDESGSSHNWKFTKIPSSNQQAEIRPILGLGN